jgi:hypothetical protein
MRIVELPRCPYCGTKARIDGANWQADCKCFCCPLEGTELVGHDFHIAASTWPRSYEYVEIVQTRVKKI